MSVIKITKETFQCRCDNPTCAHEWEADKIPSRCAKCKIRTWNRPARISSGAPLTFNGETLTVSQWARKLGFSRATIPWRIKQGWPLEQVLSNEDWRFQQ